MGLVKKIATSVGKSAAKVVAKKAIKNISKTVENTAENLTLKNANSEQNLPQKFETKSESVGIVTKTKNFLKQADKEFSTALTFAKRAGTSKVFPKDSMHLILTKNSFQN